MKNKVYISLPITGYDLGERKQIAETIKAKFIEQGYEAITPFDVCTEERKTYAYYIGKDIEALLGCNYIYLAGDWKYSKGCCAEKCVADIYGIKRIEIELWKQKI